MRRFLLKYKNSFPLKLVVFGVSLLLCLSVLELGLRLAGYAVASSRARLFGAPYDEGDYDSEYDTYERYRPAGGRKHLLLVLGDSLTNAGNVKSYQSYPYYLYRRFADAGRRTAVFNMGYCEESTSAVAARLKKYLRGSAPGRRPDAVVVLVGAADLYNLTLMRGRMKGEKSPWRDMLPSGWLASLRIYKVLRHIRMQLALRWSARRARGVPATAEEKFQKLRAAYAVHKKNLVGDERRPLDKALAARLAPLFPDEIRRYGVDIRKPGDFIELLVDHASLVYTPRLRYDRFFGLLMDIAENFPEQFWSNRFDPASYYFLQSYRVQSRYAAADVLRVMDRAAAAHPKLAGKAAYRRFHEAFADRDALDRFADKQRLSAWEQIVSLCWKNNIRLVLQNYPVEYRSANRILAAVASKYGLPLVDNRRRFAELMKTNGRAKYIEDNDHLTPAGYEIMAGNVFETLTRDGFPPAKAGAARGLAAPAGTR